MTMEGVDPDVKSLIYRLCLIWALIASSWVILQTSVPLILKDIVGRSDAAEWMGIFTATTGVSGLIFCSALGYFSDRLGRMELLNPWVVAWLGGSMCILYGEITENVYALWLPRIVALSIPSTILHAYTSDFVDGPALLQTHGYLGASFGVSVLGGSIACAVLGQMYSRSASIVLAVALASLAVGASFATKYPPHTAKNSLGSYLNALHIVRRDPLLRNIIIAFSLMRVANVNAFFMFVLYSNYRVGWGIVDTSIALGISGFLGVVWQIVGVKYIANRHHITIEVLFAVLVGAPIVMAVYGTVTTTAGMYGAVLCGSAVSVGMSIFTSKIAALGAEDGIAGLALGLVGSLMNFLEIIFALAYGKILSWTMQSCVPSDWCAGTPYYVNGGLFFIVLLMVSYTDYCYGARREAWRLGVASNPSSPTERKGERE